MELPANRIEALREEHSVSRVELAVLCGVGEATITRWERGKTAVPDEAKLLIASRFEVTPEYLMGWDREPTTTKAAA